MDELIKIIDKRIAKILSEQSRAFMKSKPAIVTAVNGLNVTVKMLDSNSIYTLPNRSGTFLNVNDNVQVYYKGDVVNSSNAYIGNSLNGLVVIAENDFDVSTAQDNVLYFLYEGEWLNDRFRYGFRPVFSIRCIWFLFNELRIL